MTAATRGLLLIATIASVAVGVCGQGNQLQEIVIKICGERHFHVSEVVVDCAARVYGEKGMHVALRECLLAHLSGHDPGASLRVSPAAVEELCAWTNISAASSMRTDADVDKVTAAQHGCDGRFLNRRSFDASAKVVPYRAGSTFYCALSKLKITPREYIRSYEDCHKDYKSLVGPEHED
ncbi:uncharacterized protein [Dermacentor andersoni]|uniref:uncharacterized protein isoform X1 n=1 Tax=Dermacentor andersoni TaxID=34620 RepID=UPI0024176EA8|nr:uncharacterized protein LOC126523950 isoform X1 [Dermacentor andersoni]